MSWIVTSTGVEFDIANPRVVDIRIEDIAEALSRVPRFTGHAGGYTVAQHCVMASRLVPDEFALHGLLHDAAEAYVGDANSPLKWEMRRIAKSFGMAASPFDIIEGRIADAIKQRFGIVGWPGKEWPEEVHTVDAILLATERRDFLPDGGGTDWACLEGVATLRETLVAWPQWQAKAKFLQAARALGVEA